MLQFYSWRPQQKKKKKRAGECGGGKDIAELEAEYVEGGAGRGGAGRAGATMSGVSIGRRHGV